MAPTSQVLNLKSVAVDRLSVKEEPDRLDPVMHVVRGLKLSDEGLLVALLRSLPLAVFPFEGQVGVSFLHVHFFVKVCQVLLISPRPLSDHLDANRIFSIHAIKHAIKRRTTTAPPSGR